MRIINKKNHVNFNLSGESANVNLKTNIGSKIKRGILWGAKAVALIGTCWVIYSIALRRFDQAPPLDVYVFGSQFGCSGPCNGTKVFKELQTVSTPFVQFKEKYFNPHYVVNGTCTPMSLGLAANIEKNCSPSKAKNLNLFTKCVEKIAYDYSTSNSLMRDRQSAFNSITVHRQAPDPLKAKIEALASYYGLMITATIPKTPLQDDSSIMALFNEIDQAEKGTYVLRTVKPADNQKLEEHGHSSILLKSEWGSLYYDPNIGMRPVGNQKIGKEIFEKFVEQDMKMFEVGYPRLYKISCNPSCRHVD